MDDLIGKRLNRIMLVGIAEVKIVVILENDTLESSDLFNSKSFKYVGEKGHPSIYYLFR